jgi:hypothetical protein
MLPQTGRMPGVKEHARVAEAFTPACVIDFGTVVFRSTE